MKLDEGKHGLTTVTNTPLGHGGYCPVLDGKVLGRYKHYEVALKHSGGGIIVLWRNVKRCGYKVAPGPITDTKVYKSNEGTITNTV